MTCLCAQGPRAASSMCLQSMRVALFLTCEWHLRPPTVYAESASSDKNHTKQHIKSSIGCSQQDEILKTNRTQQRDTFIKNNHTLLPFCLNHRKDTLRTTSPFGHPSTSSIQDGQLSSTSGPLGTPRTSGSCCWTWSCRLVERSASSPSGASGAIGPWRAQRKGHRGPR